MMPESKSSKKPTERGTQNLRGAKEKREFDAEMISLLDGLRLAPNHLGENENAGQPLNVQPPEPELVSRLVKFIKKL